MAEDTDKTTQTQTDEPAERSVPYTRFKEVNDKLADERKQRSELEGRISQLEDADKTAVERLTKDLERAQKRADEAEAKATDVEGKLSRTEKAAWVQAAAAKLNFHDPESASMFADLDVIENTADAKKAVEKMAKDKTYLVKQEQKTPALQRVGITGTEQEQQSGMVTPDEQMRQWGVEVLKGLDPSAVQDGA